MSTRARRTYLVVIDETDESGLALRYAAQRAAHVGGALALLHVLPTADFVQWGGVEAAMRAEAKAKGDTLLARVGAQAAEWMGVIPTVYLREGEAAATVLDVVREDPAIGVLVLATATRGVPGPLVSYFTGERVASLPFLITIVPGGLDEAALDALT